LIIAPRRRVDDAVLGLQEDLLALGAAELQRFAEPAFAIMRAAAGMIEAVQVCVVEHGDARLAGRRVQSPDLGIGLVGDSHHARDDVGQSDIGRS
jgi:hypothetical protein